jgi:hypothetical protein
MYSILRRWASTQCAKKFLYSLCRYPRINQKYTVKRLTYPNCDCFFGYYDLNPWDSNFRFHLAHICTKYGVEIAIFSIKDSTAYNSQPVFIDRTKCHSLQQGARLQWYDEAHIFYNHENAGFYSSTLYNIYNGSKKDLGYPLYEFSTNTHKGYTLSFSRLEECRKGYGYQTDSQLKDPISDSQCQTIYEYDFRTGKISTIFSLRQLIGNGQSARDSVDSSDYLNHLSLNPSGTRLSFLHLWGVSHRYSEMYVINLVTMHVSRITYSCFASHYTWVDDEHISIFCKPTIRSPVGYYLFDVDNIGLSNNWTYVSNTQVKLTSMDGHQTHTRNGNYISDTYPSLTGIQYLYSYNYLEEDFDVIAALPSSHRKFGCNRVDLHPRCRHDRISVDTTANEKTEIWLFERNDRVM